MFKKTKRIKLSKTKWKQLRTYVQERDRHCLVCGYAGSMSPAHVKGKGAGGDDSPNNVIWLCEVGPDLTEGCHPKYDNSKIKLPVHVVEMLENESEYLKEK